MELKEKIKSFFKGDVEDDEAVLKTYSRDASLFEMKPELVVFPKDADDIKNLVKFVNNYGEKKLSLAPRSGGTDMSGGPLTDSIVVEFDRYFNKVREVGRDFAVVEPGVYYRNFEAETLKKDLLLPTYPASREICAIGGMVANNAGGEKTLAYGKTADFVKELKAVLRDGNEYVIKPLSKSELGAKMAQGDFEGEFYRDMYRLTMEHAAEIK